MHKKKWFIHIPHTRTSLRGPMEYQPAAWQGWLILISHMLVIGTIMVIIFSYGTNPWLNIVLAVVLGAPLYTLYLVIASRYC